MANIKEIESAIEIFRKISKNTKIDDCENRYNCLVAIKTLQEKIEREKCCEYCRSPRKQWTYLEKSDKYCKNCGRDLRQSK